MYRPTFSILLFAVSFLGLAEAGLTFLGHRTVNDPTYEASIWDTAPNKEPNELYDTTFHANSLAARYQQLNANNYVMPEAHAHYLMGSLLLKLHMTIAEPQKLCRSLEHYENAIRRAPARSLYHLSWADAASRLLPLPNELCAKEISTARSSFPEAQDLTELIKYRLWWAERLEPLNVFDLYLASLVHRRIGNKPQALDLLSRVEMLNPLFTEEQQLFFYRMIAGEDELKRAITRSYPNVLNWIEYFSTERPREYQAWEKTFAEALDAALEAVPGMLIRETISTEVLSNYLKQTEQLPLVARYDTLRRRLDEYLAEVYRSEKNPAWAELLSRRKDTTRIPVVKAYLPKDLQPQATMLTHWHLDTSPADAQLSRRNASLGVFVPDGRQTTLLVLRNRYPRGHAPRTEIELYRSLDNQEFQLLNIEKQTRRYIADGREVLVIELSESGPVYLKIRQARYDPRITFKNNLASLVQVYGYDSSANNALSYEAANS